EKGWLDRAPIEIYASDASSAAIEKARRGVYRERSFRNLAPDLRARYFHETDRAWQVDSRIPKRIRWTVANLAAEADVASLGNAINIVFCRNMFIYFSDDSIRRTLRMFHRMMYSPGHLFVGASESILRLTTDLEFQELGGAFVYVKR